MPEHDLTSLDAGALLDVPREDRADRALVEADMAERVAGDRGLGIEADAEVRLRQVVVHGLRHADDRDALLVEPLRHAQRVVAADRDERVEAEPADAVEDGAPARVILSWIGAGGPEDRAALAEDRGDIARHEHARRGLAEEAR